MTELNQKLTRVTTVLEPFSGYGQIPKDILMKAAERGTKVHKILEGYMKGYGTHNADEETKPYVESALNFWGKGYPIIAMEQRFNDELLGITGQCDLIVKTELGITLIDWKTSSKENIMWPLQGSAYSYLAQMKGYEINAIWFVKLNKKGEEAEKFEYEYDIKGFSECLNIYNKYFKKQKFIDIEDL
jgi:hypothetical protein